MTHEITQIIISVITWAITGAWGAVAGWAYKGMKDAREAHKAEIKANDDRMIALCNGMRSLLRCELVRSHREFVQERHAMTLSDLEYSQRVYESYHALGGNGTGTQLWDGIQAAWSQGGNHDTRS